MHNVKPMRYRKDLAAKQETPRALLDGLILKPHFPVGGSKIRGHLRAQQLDTNVRAPRAFVDESMIPANL